MTKTIKFAGFTLIELLIVIGLLAALAAVLLPSLMGSKEEALAGLDKYNAAGTLRTLRQYEAITGLLPNGLHTGLNEDADALMPGVTAAYAVNANGGGALGSVTTLTGDEVKALANVGITHFAYGTGDPSGSTRAETLGYQPITTATKVVTMNADWEGEDGPITFNGYGYDALVAEGYTKIINLFITPTADWSATGNGWAKGFKVGMDIPGTCPVVENEFSYYTAFIGIKAEGSTTTKATPSAEVPPVTGLSSTGSLAEAMEEVDDWISDVNGNGGTVTVGTATWDETVTNQATATVTYNDSDSDNPISNGSIVFTITYSPDGTATLLGTSCPEHGVTNP
jgi:prepilin-type N-terminal cleavage/methylation domain-containing protein